MASEDIKDISKMERHVDDKSSDDSVPIPVFDSEMERKIVRKIDVRLIPILLILFLVSFVDRSNIGNAKIQGLEKSLGMKGNQFNIAVFVFNIPYVLLDIPSNLLLRKANPAWMLGSMMFCWGIVTIAQGLTKNFAGLVACRTLMGIFEAGFVPGCASLIGSYYKRHEFQLRYSLFFSASILAGAFSGFLAYLLVKMDGVGGYEGWRWIFIIEGLITVIVAVTSIFIICPWPKDSKFLTMEEKSIMLQRLEVDSGPGQMEHWSANNVKTILMDWKIWLGMIAYFGADNTAGSFSTFAPTILKTLGYTSAQAQVHSIPIYMVALVCSISAAYLSDRFQKRYIFCMFGVTIASIGWAIQLAFFVNNQVRYFALFLSLSGTFILMPVLVVWLSNNMGGNFKRSFATAFQIGIGNTAAFVSSNTFTTDASPRYKAGYGAGLGLQLMAGVACTAMFLGLWWENKKRDKGGRAARHELSAEKLKNLGDDHPDFRYTL